MIIQVMAGMLGLVGATSVAVIVVYLTQLGVRLIKNEINKIK